MRPYSYMTRQTLTGANALRGGSQMSAKNYGDLEAIAAALGVE